ncbi:hypothetical protein AMECASPLE_000484 [Ameca splendens]|uniref:Uncharacterized protein n=1 Tax=Ameca splendens TaxID=208324 RepID=A0ABV0XLS1_9TELE
MLFFSHKQWSSIFTFEFNAKLQAELAGLQVFTDTCKPANYYKTPSLLDNSSSVIQSKCDSGHTKGIAHTYASQRQNYDTILKTGQPGPANWSAGLLNVNTM